jgi:hypothetical protein
VVQALAVDLEEVGLERRRRLAFEVGRDRPVFLLHEGPDLALALGDQAVRNRLHAPGGEAAPHLLP